MSRRGLTIVLHWSVFMLVLVMLKGGTVHAGVRWAFVAAGGLWLVSLLGGGPLARPGPKLQGVLRDSFAALHWGMFALLAIAVLLTLGSLLGLADVTTAWNAHLVLLGAAAFHGIFHFWRHTALRDGAFRMMVPKIWHKYL